MTRPLSITICSGGMDSVTLAHLCAVTHDQHLLSFDYGQRHRKELEYAKRCAERLGARWSLIDLSMLRDHIGTSALTSDAPVPDGHYAEDTMRQTVVPNRNAIMLAIATGIAVAENADRLATGVHGGDHYIYPDCRPEFTQAFEYAMRRGNDGFINGAWHLWTPFIFGDKGDIALAGHSLRVPWTETWSCYKGGDIHCGSCGTCFERREAFQLAGIPDPTEYAATPDYDDPRA